MFTLAFMVKKRFSNFYICLSKNIIKFEFENLLFIYMCLINSNIFVVSTAELFLGKYIFIWKVFIYW